MNNRTNDGNTAGLRNQISREPEYPLQWGPTGTWRRFNADFVQAPRTLRAGVVLKREYVK